MSLASVIFPTGTYTVTRTEAGEYDEHGRYTDGDMSTFSLVADVQPVEGRELKDLPEGLRAEETLVVYCATELRALKAAVPDASSPDIPGNVPDLIEIDGEQWRVVRVQRFRVLANRWRAWVERIGQG